jgi:hypothetical protein
MPSAFTNSIAPIHPITAGKPSNPIKTKRLQTAPLDTNGAPLSMTKTTQIRLPQYDVLPLWAIFFMQGTDESIIMEPHRL